MQVLTLKFYLYKFFNDLIVIYPAYSLMFKQHQLSVIQISNLLIIWSTITIAFEIPSGIIADKLPRKYLLMLGSLLKSISFLIWLKHSFFYYGLGFISWGLGSALKSGTFFALVYDELKNRQETKFYEKISGRCMMFSNIAIAIALSIGGVISQYSFNLSLIFSFIASLLAFVIALSLPSTQPQKSTGEKKYLIFLWQAIKETKKDKLLLKLIIILALVFGIRGAYDELAPLVLNKLGFNIPQVGLIGAISYSIISLGQLLAHRFKKSNLLLFLAGLLFLIAALKPIAIIIVPLILAEFFIAIAEVKFSAKMQDQIDSNKRATTISIKRLILELVGIAAYAFMGLLSNLSSIYIVYWIMGITLLGTSLIKLKNKTTSS